MIAINIFSESGSFQRNHFHCLKCGKLFELNGCLERLEN